VFVSSITQEIADQIRPIINNNIKAKLTFVALKDADQSILKKLVPDVIDWSDLSNSEPKNWEAEFWKAYGCSGSLPTIPPPITVTTLKPAKTTTRKASTQTISGTTPATSPLPYLPCKRQVFLWFDASNDLTSGMFSVRLKKFFYQIIILDSKRSGWKTTLQ
jgi:hypothetical protein